MKLIFAGTPEFAALALQALISAGHEISLVLTQPDRRAGRGMALRASAVKMLAQSSGLTVFQPSTLKEASTQERIREVGADLMIVAAYGLILPQVVLDIPRLGCLNIHASLLPRWRGAAPIQRAILAGDTETGVCIMQMHAGLDTGPVLQRASIPIGEHDNAASLHDQLALLGAHLIVQTLEKMPLPAVPQPEANVTYASKIEKSEAMLNWHLPAVQLARQIRAFNPFPGASTHWHKNPLKIWQASVVDLNPNSNPNSNPNLSPSSSLSPGTILSADKDGIIVACGAGYLRLTELQKAGGKRLTAAQFVAGSPADSLTGFDEDLT